MIDNPQMIKGMTTVKELRDWLVRFPDETEVEFMFQNAPTAWASFGDCTFKSPELTDGDMGDGWEFNDWSKNQFVGKDHPQFGKKTLQFGEAH